MTDKQAPAPTLTVSPKLPAPDDPPFDKYKLMEKTDDEIARMHRDDDRRE